MERVVHFLSSENLNELVYKISSLVMRRGSPIVSRDNEKVTEITDVSLILKKPRNRHLYLSGRKNNIFSTIAETFWVLSGDNKIFPFLDYFIPRALNYSDNFPLLKRKENSTWRGSYGHRIYQHAQLENILDAFKSDLNTRRAVMTIWQPEFDTNINIKKKDGLNNSKDIPCTILLHFWIRKDELNLKTVLRSNDLVWGLSGINIFEFTFIQEMLLNLINKSLDIDERINLGYYHHSVTSLHIYDHTKSQIVELMNTEQNLKTQSTKECLFFDLKNNSFLVAIKPFFAELIAIYTTILVQSNNNQDFEKKKNKIEMIFKKYQIDIKNNQLFDYALALLIYIMQKENYIEINLILLKSKIQNFSDDFLSVFVNNFNRLFNTNI